MLALGESGAVNRNGRLLPVDYPPKIDIIFYGCRLAILRSQPFSMWADVAQLVEHSTRNTEVMGSNPIVGFVTGLGK